MRIIQIFNRYREKGGEENSVDRMALHLRANGHKVERFIRSSKEWEETSAPSSLLKPFLLIYNDPVLTELERLHQKHAADVWIAHNILPVVSIGVYSLAKRLRVPIVQWLHNYRPLTLSGVLDRKDGIVKSPSICGYSIQAVRGDWLGRLPSLALSVSYLWAIHRRWFDHVAGWVAVSKAMGDHFAAADWYPDKIRILHHSWETKEPLGLKVKRSQFLFLGRMIPEKGLGFLLSLFQSKRLENCRLVIAGDGLMKSEFLALCQDCPDRFSYAGWVTGDKKCELIARSNAILFPSLWEEPLSTVAYEAYEQKRPILTSDRGGMAEIVRDKKTGRVLTVDDSQPWLDAIVELSEEPDLADMLGNNGRNWLDAERNGKRWVDQFDSLISDLTKEEIRPR